MPVIRIDLAYDGTDFHGYARQPGVRTVQSELEEALSRRFGTLRTEVAGRTDAGVHAAHQVVSFTLPDLPDFASLLIGLRKMLPNDIAVISCEEAPEGFSARYSAQSRTYRYRIHQAPHHDPVHRRFRWHVRWSLDLGAMNEAAALIVGEHDFASFCRRAKGKATIRTVHNARWARSAHDLVELEIEARAFCHQMVRSIVALCVDVGRGKLPADDVTRVLSELDRNAGCGAAPARGLTLHKVTF
ncbi:MAG: tRNA pseudouridine(38-40) synthase TruA [Acidimicrobiia bacterium]|nr:tRNA pseudouridine(38-40) synthase TruA [Acidimicrobiia bacterium]